MLSFAGWLGGVSAVWRIISRPAKPGACRAAEQREIVANTRVTHTNLQKMDGVNSMCRSDGTTLYSTCTCAACWWSTLDLLFIVGGADRRAALTAATPSAADTRAHHGQHGQPGTTYAAASALSSAAFVWLKYGGVPGVLLDTRILAEHLLAARLRLGALGVQIAAASPGSLR